ncbi:hypothetical protein Tsubulata_006423 [Turnera subulata]|uniref:DUF4283 domain-containing protein n=1 Tax=Turnera subulata TaxID=218843 RepID=A0A9Q0G0W8_9ROSI|nr:hypothetical protein Tsubulata_006423 [Turnera subulata]
MASTSQNAGINVAREPGAQLEILSETEEEVLELEAAGPAQRVQPQLSLLAKVLGTKHVNPQAFSNLMGRLWNPKKGIKVEQLGRNLFLFHFFSKRDRQEVQEAEAPWFFDKRVVVLKEVTGDEVLTQGWGNFIRARVLMHVEKPIRKSIWVRTGAGMKRTEDSDEEERTIYGEWLRASLRKPFRLRTEGHLAPKPAVAKKLVYPETTPQRSGASDAGHRDKEQLAHELIRLLCLDQRQLFPGLTPSPNEETGRTTTRNLTLEKAHENIVDAQSVNSKDLVEPNLSSLQSQPDTTISHIYTQQPASLFFNTGHLSQGKGQTG